MEYIQYFTKRIRSSTEADIHLLASLEGIAPAVKFVNTETIRSEMHTPLSEIPLKERSMFCNDIVKLVERLHNLGVLWLDGSEENVVVDKEGRCYLIDFGLSQIMDKLALSNITLEEAKEIEKDEVRFFCGVGEKPNEIAVIDGMLVREEI